MSTAQAVVVIVGKTSETKTGAKLQDSARGRLVLPTQEPTVQNPLRLAYRFLIRDTIRDVILTPEQDPLTLVQRAVALVGDEDRDNVLALINEELRRIHEGVLARYGLRPSELAAWQAHRQTG